jgi:hypothetical protein
MARCRAISQYLWPRIQRGEQQWSPLELMASDTG